MRYAVIMAGGGGTRLWPSARRHFPKQLQPLIFERPLIAETVHRMSRHYDPARILIVTARRYEDDIRAAIPELPAENVIAEPFGRNTAAAIALAALRIRHEDPDGAFAALPADHVILQPDELFRALDFAHQLAESHRVVDIGVRPDRPETGYGYIELGDALQKSESVPDEGASLAAYEVRRFVEKPDLETARRYLEAGTYLWNSGMFVWRAAEFLRALEEHLPDTYRRLEPAFASGNWDRLAEAYEAIEDISVDYAIMERTRDVIAVPADFGWRDIGDWAALYDLMEHDADGNAASGPIMALDTQNSLLLSTGKLVAAIGVRDLVVVETEDALLVMPRERAQEVKSLLEELKSRGDDRYL